MWRIPADPEAGEHILSMNLLLMLALLTFCMLCPERAETGKYFSFNIINLLESRE